MKLGYDHFFYDRGGRLPGRAIVRALATASPCAGAPSERSEDLPVSPAVGKRGCLFLLSEGFLSKFLGPRPEHGPSSHTAGQTVRYHLEKRAHPEVFLYISIRDAAQGLQILRSACDLPSEDIYLHPKG